jgi:hypothetical protein
MNGLIVLDMVILLFIGLMLYYAIDYIEKRFINRDPIFHRKLIRSRIQCKTCKTIIESKHRHDLVTCKCGDIFLDGGLDYQRIGGKGVEKRGYGYIDVSEYVDYK